MHCRICGNLATEYKHNQLAFAVPDAYPLAGDMRLFLCEGCDFVFSCTSSKPADYTAYYSQFNKHQVRATDAIRRDSDYFSGLLDFLGAASTASITGSRILDFGSGSRDFSRLALAKGAEAATNYDVGQGDLDEEYDWIVSTHCFEHLMDPREELRELTRHLTPGGHVCIGVPDLDRYRDVYYGPWSHFDLEHINHFNYKSLQHLFASAGLRPVAFRQCDRLVGPTLAYPEILIVGMKPIDQDKRRFIEENLDKFLQDLIADYELDLESTLESIERAYDRALRSSDDGLVTIGFYGISSYALRVISMLSEKRPELTLDFFADTDIRLKGMRLFGHPIMDFDSYVDFVAKEGSRGHVVVTLVAAINGYRIVDMLKHSDMHLKSELILLPPECQNRKVPA